MHVTFAECGREEDSQTQREKQMKRERKEERRTNVSELHHQITHPLSQHCNTNVTWDAASSSSKKKKKGREIYP